jgi:site-specific recombinase XerD
MAKSIVLTGEYNPILAQIVDGSRRAVKDTNARLGLFCQWQTAHDQPWFRPDLAAWRDDLLAGGLKPTSVAAYLSTVRGAYHRALRDNTARQWLLDQIPNMGPDGAVLSPADRKAMLDELLVRLQNAIHPDTAPVKLTRVQDMADSAHLRLTSGQAEQLVGAPDVSDMQGLRDAAVFAMLLCTGIREDELCHLDVTDLRQSYGGALALRVRHGKGNKQRLIPYGAMDWCLILADRWLARAGIAGGWVFRGLYKGGEIIREGRMDTRSVQRILARYPIAIDGALMTVTPHDCRRTYARLQYENGMEQIAIQQNLGHADIRTTLNYIGILDADRRRGRPAIRYNLSQLDE